MNKELGAFRQLLKRSGNFATGPRLLLFETLQTHPALTIGQLIKYLSKYDQATVYRNIKLFEELGIISRLRLGWESKLELSDKFQHHHHHITCTKCGSVITLKEDPLLEKRLAVLAQKYEFVQSDHQIEIKGVCKNCSN